jgi:RNA polymerase sigma-70 factor (ECF subfamily)
MSPDIPFDRYRAMLLLHVRTLQIGRQLRARFDASDVVNEALMRAVRGLDGRRGADEPELIAWLKTIVKNTFIDLVRKHSAEKCDPRQEQAIADAASDSATPLGALLSASQPGPCTLAAKREELLRLAAALDRLPEAERDAVIARFILKLPLCEAAVQLGRSEKGVAALIYRGKCRLRELLGESGDTT